MADKTANENPVIRIGSRLDEAFGRLQDRIRERAYHLSFHRSSGEGDSMSDWLKAQSEILAPIEFEVKEQKKNIVVEGDLKGFYPAEIEIEVVGDVLRVYGSHTESSEKKQGGDDESSSESVCFFQSVQLPDAVDLDECQAKLFKNGKLKVTLPRRLQEKP